MATHDYVIANDTGASVRADINNVLQAILTNNSSSSSPSTTAAYMFWADTTSGTLKIRNSSDNAWVELLQLDGTITLEDGSVTTPALAFRDDLNTGIYSAADDRFNIAVGGVDRLEIRSDEVVFNETGENTDFRIEGDTDAELFFVDAGNERVGISTNTPSDHLTVSHSANTAAGITIENTNNSQASAIAQLLIAGGDNSKARLKIETNGAFHTIDEDNNGNLIIEDNGSEKMRIDSSGRVGIGITSPDQKLVVADTSSVSLIRVTANNAQEAGIDFGDTDDNDIGRIRYDNSVNAMRFFVNAAERMRIDSSGKFGLGVSSLGSAFIEARENSPVAGRLLALGTNGTATTSNASGMSNALVLFRVRVEVAPNTTTDLVSGYGGSLVLITMVNNGGDDVQQTRVRTHAWSTSTSLFFNTYGSNQPTVTFSVSSGVLKVNHNHTGNIFFNCAGFIITGPQSG